MTAPLDDLALGTSFLMAMVLKQLTCLANRSALGEAQPTKEVEDGGAQPKWQPRAVRAAPGYCDQNRAQEPHGITQKICDRIEHGRVRTADFKQVSRVPTPLQPVPVPLHIMVTTCGPHQKRSYIHKDEQRPSPAESHHPMETTRTLCGTLSKR